MKIIIITRPDFFEGEDTAIRLLFEAGLDILHLRKPECSETEIAGLIEKIPAGFRNRIVLHDHHRLAVEYGLYGIHLNGRNPVPPEGFAGHISCSCHSIAELEEKASRKAPDGSPYFGYLFLSPIFDSISKQGYMSAYTPEEIRKAAATHIISERTIALGGIDACNIASIAEYGFGGAAILGYAWKNTENDTAAPAGNYMRLRKAIKGF